MERKSISKKLRFEVYKRDSFTCQYCGRKAPDVVLNIDHIKPVAKGGTNDILNLITSCFDCNNGKRDILLDEDSILSKQRLQLEQLQERREQIEMMFEWKKSLEDLGDYTSDLLIEYVESKISPHKLNDSGVTKVSILLKKFSIDEIFDAIDKGAKTYLKFDDVGQLTKESVNLFINKLGGIAAYQKKPLVDQKIHYIKGICRNRFSYWDDKKGLAILGSYVKALRTYGWSEEQILHDLETEVSALAKSAKNWSEWREKMDGWTCDIKNWDKESDDVDSSTSHYGMELSEIKEIAKWMRSDIIDLFELIDYLSIPFGNQKADRCVILRHMKDYVYAQITILTNHEDISKLEPNYQICKKLHFFDTFVEIDTGLKFAIDNMFTEHAVNWLRDTMYLPSRELTDAKDFVIFKQYFNQILIECGLDASDITPEESP